MWRCYYLIDFTDHIAGEGKQGRYKLTKEEGSSENITLELNDDATTPGTPINRQNLMAIQGFQAQSMTVNDTGQFVVKNSSNQTLTITLNSDGSITEKFVGDKTITKTTTFGINGVSEVIS